VLVFLRILLLLLALLLSVLILVAVLVLHSLCLLLSVLIFGQAAIHAATASKTRRKPEASQRQTPKGEERREARRRSPADPSSRRDGNGRQAPPLWMGSRE
jgi:hypothetical protein